MLVAMTTPSSPSDRTDRHIFSPYIDAIVKLSQAVDVFRTGVDVAASIAVTSIEAHRNLVISSGRPDPYSTPEALQKAIADARRSQEFASLERAQGHPYLYALALIRLWSIVENMVDDLITDLLAKRPKARDSKITKNIKVSLVDFMAASESERTEMLAGELKQAVSARLKVGVGRFEALLEPLGLGGSVPDPVRRAVLEHSQLRNVLVHKDGKVDARLADHCPWLGYKVGETVLVSRAQFARAQAACNWYVFELARRLNAFDGEPPPNDGGLQALFFEHLVASDVTARQPVPPAS